MKKYLLGKEGGFYKANLHCHTTISDGKKTPEQIKEMYKNAGYSVVAYTDHDVLIPHDELCDGGFIALNGVEVAVKPILVSPTPIDSKTCHICMIAIKQDNITQPLWNEKYVHVGRSRKYISEVKHSETEPPYEYKYTGEGISEIMRGYREAGFFVTYNHPTWSQESYPEYINYFGMHAMEMFNGSCLMLGYDEYNSRVYDDMLKSGKRIFCVGTDDNHNAPKNPDSFRAFTMINAKALTYDDITAALLRGDFYASEAPEIHELYYKNGKIHIECTPVREITVNCLTRRSCHIRSENGEPITSADIGIPYDAGYFRVTVTDNAGCRATTNAYFLDELK